MDEKDLFLAYKKATLEYLKNHKINHETVEKMLLAMHLVSAEFLNALFETVKEKEITNIEDKNDEY